MGTLSNLSLPGPSASDVKLASDGRNLDNLKRNAASDPKGAVREAAKQFESLFMGELLKTMRASTQASGLMDNAGSKLGTEMLDAQLASKTAGRPGGLSEVIARQLDRQMGHIQQPAGGAERSGQLLADAGLQAARRSAGTPDVPAAQPGLLQRPSLSAELAALVAETPEHCLNPADADGTVDLALDAQRAASPGGLTALIERQLQRQMALVPGPIPSTTQANNSLPTVAEARSTPKVPEKSAAGFVQQHTVAAQAVQAETGIPAPFMLAQAALETGWGKREIIGRDGTNSHNLFGIKAGGSWNGPTVEVTTTEYIGGQPRKMIQKFRAYANEAESFADYARLMKDSPRYAKVLERAGDAKAFAMGLQKAGYATDPLYGQKLGQVINTTLRLQRDMA
jgi:flagellar protein FlgJ